MNRLLNSFILVLIINSFYAQNDSGNVVRFRGMYFSFGEGIPSEPKYQFSKYMDKGVYHFESRNYKFKFPNIGIGYVLSNNGFYIRTDVNYSFAAKQIDDVFFGNGYITNGRSGYSVINSQTIYYSGATLLGTNYYRYKDEVKGNLYLHYLGIEMALGGNMLPYLRMYSGWRYSALVDVKYNVDFTRNIETYSITAIAPTFKDSLLETSVVKFTGDEFENMTNQTIGDKLYTFIGLSCNFNIHKYLFMVDLQYDHNGILFNRPEFSQDYLTLRLAYVVKYSTFFGRK